VSGITYLGGQNKIEVYMIFSSIKRTDFIADGISLSVPQSSLTSVNSKYRYPRVIDSRDLCIMTSDQGQTPHCVGYSTAGYLEIEFWKRFHYPVQFPADAIYKQAKTFDSDKGDGTSLESGLAAAKVLGLFKGTVQTFGNDIDTIKFMLHTHGRFVGAFGITDEWNSVNIKTGCIGNFSSPKTLGGHAVLICGYCDVGLYVQNSWGFDGWGKYGFALIPWNLVQIQFYYGAVINDISMEESECLAVIQKLMAA